MSILDEYNHGSNGYHGYSLVVRHSQNIRVIRGLFSFCSHRPAGGCDARADGSQSRGYNTTETGCLKRGSLSTKSIAEKNKNTAERFHWALN